MARSLEARRAGLLHALGSLAAATVALAVFAQEAARDPVAREETPPPAVNLTIYRFDGAAVAEDKEETPGIAFLWNADNDDGGDKLDKDDPDGEYAQENDLHKITLSIDPSVKTGIIKLEMVGHGDNHGSVKLWTHATKRTPVALPKTWTLGQHTVPAELWVEGLTGAHDVRDVELKLSHDLSGVSDSLRITVVPLIPVAATVGGSSDILKGAAWKPGGAYCLMAGFYPAFGQNGRVGKYEYLKVSPTLLDTGENVCFFANGWNLDGTFALVGGSTRILKYDGTVFTKIHDETNRTFHDVKWRPRGDYAFIPAERRGHAYKCNGTTTEDLQMPDSPDASNADWHPSGDYVICSGDTGCHWKWTAATGTWANVSGLDVAGNVTAFHPSGDYALLGCYDGRVYRYSHAQSSYSVIRNTGTANTRGICWRPQGNYAILAGSARSGFGPKGRHVLLYDHGQSNFYEVDTHTDELPFRNLAWHPTENYAAGAVDNADY